MRRCRNLWWTLYTIDRHCSLSMGLPISTRDSDVTAKFPCPSSHSQSDSTFGLQIKLYRSLSDILTSEFPLCQSACLHHSNNDGVFTIAVYRSEQIQLLEFLEMTRSIMHRMAGHAHELEGIIQVREQESVDAISRDTRHIMLLYHQVRPAHPVGMLPRCRSDPSADCDVASVVRYSRNPATSPLPSEWKIGAFEPGRRT